MVEVIDVSVPAPITVDVLVAPPIVVEVYNGYPAQQVYVQDIEPEFSGPGIWVQTGLGSDGTDFTIWINK